MSLRLLELQYKQRADCGATPAGWGETIKGSHRFSQLKDFRYAFAQLHDAKTASSFAACFDSERSSP